MNSIPPIPGPPPIPKTLTGAIPPRTSRLAISSLVLGICGLFTCGVTSLAGLVIGIIALGKIKQSNGRLSGKSLANAGIGVSAVVAIAGLAIAGAVLVPAAAKTRAYAQTEQCMGNLKKIGLAACLWSNDHDDTFPPDFLTMSNELGSPKYLTCPADHHRSEMRSWAQFNPVNVSYEYMTPGSKEASYKPQTVVFRCPVHMTVSLSDGSVQKATGRPLRP